MAYSRYELKYHFFTNSSSKSTSCTAADLLVYLKRAVSLAVSKYRLYHEEGKFARGEIEYTGYMLYWSTGQSAATAFLLQSDIWGNLDEALSGLNKKFTNVATSYNRHSFASYLLDELVAVNKKVKILTPTHPIEPDNQTKLYRLDLKSKTPLAWKAMYGELQKICNTDNHNHMYNTF